MVRHPHVTGPTVISIQEARETVLERAGGLLARERVPVTLAVGRVLAADVRADGDLPPFDRVMMDGYAVRAADTARVPARLPVRGEVAAGDAGETPLAAGAAQAIMTGAPLPPGADAVVPVEWTRPDGETVVVERGVRPGQHVAPRGEDVRAGDAVLRAGHRVGTLSLSLLIATGAAEVDVVARPVVALLTSGNELVPPGAPVRRGQIRESNGPALASLFRSCGAEVMELGVARDTREDLAARLERGRAADVLVLTGGSSVGKYDLSAEVVETLGATRHFDRIAVKPGKPTLFHSQGSRLLFCLPGNPVAALMTGRVLVCAALARRAGLRVAAWSEASLPLANDVARNAQRDQLLPMRRTPGGLAFAGWHGSGDLACMAAAEGFGFVARGEGTAPAGTPADWFPLPADAAW
jgi:molybdenum cofactor synthesis domain-containing protein